MPISPVAIADSTPQQRLDYARNFLNLPVEETDSDEQISAKIAAAQPGATQIFVQTPDTVQEQAETETADVPLREEEATGKMAGSLGRGDPRAVIHIPVVESEDGAGSRDVLVGVNGRAWQLKRGHNLPVPWRVVEALKNAEMDIVRHSQEEGHEGEVIVRKAARIAVQLLESPPKAEIDAWLERTGAEFCA